MEELKQIVLPATLSYAGVRASALLGTTNTLVQILSGIVGAAAGIFLAKKLAKV